MLANTRGRKLPLAASGSLAEVGQKGENMWNRIAAATFVALWVAVSADARAQSPAAAPGELTALDYFEIQQLVAKYARAIDTCSNNGYDYADLFTPDGAFIPSFNGKPGAPLQGRERLAEVSGGGHERLQEVGGSCRASVTSI